MAIDLAVSRAVTRIRALERAVHDNGPWALDLDGLVRPAQKTLGENDVRFSAHFPAIIQPGVLTLLCNGRPIFVSRTSVGSAQPFEVAFELSLPAEVAA